MPRVYLGNFDFEYELAGGRTLPEQARNLSKDLATVWLAVAQPGEWIVTETPGEIDGVLFGHPPRGPEYELIPWGWSEPALALAAERGWMANAPPLEAVRRVNHRQFRFGVEQELEVAPPYSALVTTEDEAERAIVECCSAGTLRWHLKAGFGTSGREQFRGTGLIIDRVRNWIRAQLKRSGSMVFEPQLERESEAGIHWETTPCGWKLLGTTPLLETRQGAYEGSRMVPREEQLRWAKVLLPTAAACDRLLDAGYFGPASFDAMFHRVGDELRLRPLQDFNVRWSMGRLALELQRRRCPENAWCVWRHLTWDGPIERLDERIAELQCRFQSVHVERLPLPPRDLLPRQRRVTVLMHAMEREWCDAVDQGLVQLLEESG